MRNLLADDLVTAVDEILEPTDALTVASVNPSRTESLQKAMTRRPELLIAKAEVEKQGVVLRYHHNQMFPALDLVGSYGGLAVEHASREATLATLGDLEHPIYAAGVVLKIPIGNTAARNHYKASRALKEQALLRLKKVEQDIFVQVSDAVGSLERLRKRVSATQKARQYAAAALDAERKIFLVGKSSTIVVSEFERNLVAAHTAEMLALTDYNKTLAQLTFGEGSTLERNEITLESE